MHNQALLIPTKEFSHPTPRRKPALPLVRNEYGAISPKAALDDACLKQLHDILALAVKSGHLNAPYVRSDRREMESLNHDIYDVLLERGRIRGIIVQERTYWKDLRKSRTRLTKRYVLLTRVQRSLRAAELDTATCAKRAKNTATLGELVQHYTGVKPVRCKAPRVVVEHACKVLARDGDGTLRSVFDGSEYRVGVWRAQAAAPHHGGGYYFYWSEQDALAGIQANTTFAAAWKEGVELVLCEVEVGGRIIQYAEGKHAASRLRVSGELQTLQRRSKHPPREPVAPSPSTRTVTRNVRPGGAEGSSIETPAD
jgi:hypothetical protein